MVARPANWKCIHCDKLLERTSMPEGIKIAIVLCLRCGTIQVQDTNCFREPKSSSEAIVCTIALMENFPLIAVTRKAYLAYRLLTELH